MYKIILCILTCLILTCCESNYKRENIKYYKVENFEVCGKVDSYVQTCREWYSGKLNIYNMDLSIDGDTIHVSYATQETMRFFTGDTIYLWYDRWLLKN